MSLIAIPRRQIWTSQPQQPCRLADWVSPRSSRIFNAAAGPVDLATGRPLVLVGANPLVAPVSAGLAFDTNNAASRYEIPLAAGDGVYQAAQYILFAQFELTYVNSGSYGQGVVELSAGYGKQVWIGSSSLYTQSKRVACSIRPNNQHQTYTRAVDAASNTEVVTVAVFCKTGARPEFFAKGAGWSDYYKLANALTNAADTFDKLTFCGTSYDALNASFARRMTIAGVLAQPDVSPEIAEALVDNPWQIFAPRETYIFVPVSAGGGSTLNAAATGQSTAGGSAGLAAQVALAAVGVSVAGGAASPAVNVPLSAAGLSVAGGAANAQATVTISAAGLAQAAGQAGLSAQVLLAGAGAATAAGNATLAAQLNALASGAAQASGTANLSGGAPGSLGAAGQARADGSAVLSVSINLVAAGAAQASGTATGTASAPGALNAAGAAQAGGAATWSALVTLPAAGFVQAMGAGSFSALVPLSASGQASAGGQAGAALGGQVHHFRLAATVARKTALQLSARRTTTLHHEVRHA